MKSKKGRLLTIIAWALIALMLMVGCSTDDTSSTTQNGEASSDNNEQGEKKKVGVLIADFSDQFQVYMMDGMKEEAEKYPDIEFSFQDAKYDANTQMSQMENMVAEGVDAVIVMPVDVQAAVPMIDKAAGANIPIISVNRKLLNQEKAVTYVGSDSVESGRILMSHMAELLDGKGNIAILEGTQGHEPQINRQKGIEEVLEEYPDIKVVADQSADWYRDKAMTVAESWFQSTLDINAIVAHNDEMAIGALLAAKDAGKADDILIAGIDATPEALDYVEKGELAFTVFQDAKGQGRGAIDAAVKVLNGEPVEKEIIIPYELVTKDKVAEYRAKYE
jgi:inositol transport system substrate-binding protein